MFQTTMLSQMSPFTDDPLADRSGPGSIFVRKIARPIEKLSETVSKVAKGDLSHEVPLTTKDEIGQLAADVNTMIVELKEWDRIKQYLTFP